MSCIRWRSLAQTNVVLFFSRPTHQRKKALGAVDGICDRLRLKPWDGAQAGIIDFFQQKGEEQKELADALFACYMESGKTKAEQMSAAELETSTASLDGKMLATKGSYDQFKKDHLDGFKTKIVRTLLRIINIIFACQ